MDQPSGGGRRQGHLVVGHHGDAKREVRPERSGTVNTKLTLFFEGVLGALAYLHSNRATTLAGEARRLCRGVMTKVLTKMAYWNPDLDFDAAMDSLPDGTDLTVLKERIKPVISSIDEIKRVEGQRRD